MTRERYEELRAAGPEITAEDMKRLERFVPRLTPIALAVHIAWYGKGWHKWRARP